MDWIKYQEFAKADADAPAEQKGTGMYRTLFLVEVLSNKPVNEMGLKDIAHEISEGDSSGDYNVLAAHEISQQDMAEALESQRSDPSFLLGEDAWKYNLHNGDEVTISPADGEDQKITISEITWVNDVARITDKQGNKYEVKVDEIS